MRIERVGTRRCWYGFVFLVAAMALPVLAAAKGDEGNGHDDDDDEMPFAEARLFFELNDTDGDLGIHGLIDGDAWKRLAIEDPDEQKMLNVYVNGRLKRQGLTEIFFESDEPSFDELPPDRFFRRFPAGEYEIEAVTLEGDELESEVELSHVMPAPAEELTISGVPAAEDCDVEPLPEVAEPIVIDWEEVDESHPEIGEDGDIEVETYQVVVEREEEPSLLLTFDLPPDVTEVQLPPGLIESGDELKFEIVVRADNGNQTAVESCFVVD